MAEQFSESSPQSHRKLKLHQWTGITDWDLWEVNGMNKVLSSFGLERKTKGLWNKTKDNQILTNVAQNPQIIPIIQTNKNIFSLLFIKLSNFTLNKIIISYNNRPLDSKIGFDWGNYINMVLVQNKK